MLPILAITYQSRMLLILHVTDPVYFRARGCGGDSYCMRLSLPSTCSTAAYLRTTHGVLRNGQQQRLKTPHSRRRILRFYGSRYTGMVQYHTNATTLLIIFSQIGWMLFRMMKVWVWMRSGFSFKQKTQERVGILTSSEEKFRERDELSLPNGPKIH